MKNILCSVFIMMLGAFIISPAHAADKFKVAWSHYTGWEAWGYIQESGLMAKHAAVNNIEVDVVLINDYIESINLYTAGEFDGVTVTNMDALTIPAVGGIDTTAIIIGDYSNGNDAIIAQNIDSVADMKGKTVMLVELSVSHYLLARALEEHGISERDLKVVNTSDADIGGLFMSDDDAIVVTWNPIVNEIMQKKNAVNLYDSSKIQGEILDMMVVKTDAPDTLKKALTGAWYEAMDIMSGVQGEDKKIDALKMMAEQAGGTLEQFEQQLKTTEMFYTGESAVKYATSETIKKTMEDVSKFSFDKGLYGEGMSAPTDLGIQLPDGSVLGNDKNVKLRFDNSFMAIHIDEKK